MPESPTRRPPPEMTAISSASLQAWTRRCWRRSPPVWSSAEPTRATHGGRKPTSRVCRWPTPGGILALGCGTGVEVRALARLAQADTAIVGVDHSRALIDTARRLTADEGLSDNITYQVGDAHHAPYGDGEFDIVTLHTLISHVDDPLQVLREARRLVRPGGTVAVFDGDYASLTFAYPDHALAKTIEEKLIQLIVANPRIMRDLLACCVRRGWSSSKRTERSTPTSGAAASGWAPPSPTARCSCTRAFFPRNSSTTGAPSRPDRPPTTPSSGRPTTTPI
jgi:SAM-dependent methyltransferase